jgi:hypothetical protein
MTTEYQLLGLGIRTVSFLGIQVYVVGVYVATDDLAALQRAFVRAVRPADAGPGATAATALVLPDEKEQLRALLLDAQRSERVWTDVLRRCGVRSMLRIVPTRTTDFGHLRDGWMRAIAARTQARAVSSSSTSAALAKKGASGAQEHERGTGGDDDDGNDRFDDEAFAGAVQEFKAMFAGSSRKNSKGTPMLLVRDGRGRLKVLYGGGGDAGGRAGEAAGSKANAKEAVAVRIGSVADERISRLIWLNYLAGAKVASEGARQSVVEGVLKLVERPVGTPLIAPLRSST